MCIYQIILFVFLSLSLKGCVHPVKLREGNVFTGIFYVIPHHSGLGDPLAHLFIGHHCNASLVSTPGGHCRTYGW